MELFSPGFGIPGVIGISSLVLFFYGHLVAGITGYESLAMFIIGVILVLIEFFSQGDYRTAWIYSDRGEFIPRIR